MNAPTHLARANELLAAGRLDEAAVGYRAAIDAAPDDPIGYLLLADLYGSVGNDQSARAVLDVGLLRLPSSFMLSWARCMSSLPLVYADETEIELARFDYATRLYSLRRRWRSGAVAVAEAAAAVGAMMPVQLPYQGQHDKVLATTHGHLAAEIMAAAFPQWATIPSREWRADEPISVGFVSGCFWRHSVWRMPTRGWIENLDRTRFRLIGYHTRTEHDDQTDEASRLFDRFVSGPRSTAEWAAIIERDAPRVLIYPELGMDGASFRLAALRLAPVQCTSFGHPVTSGLPTIDYYLTSDLMEPPDADGHYSEKLIRLPGLGTAYDPHWASWGDPLPTGDAWADIGLPSDAVRFLCCQTAAKYLPAHDDVLPRIADALPAARFVFVENGRQTPTAILKGRLAAAFARHGASAAAFCRFVPGRPHAEFSALIRDSDVFLDTLEWSGCNTLLDALAHGVPAVTLPGQFMRGRHAAAILTAAGVTDTIASSVDHYVALAVRLGSDALLRQRTGCHMKKGGALVFGDICSVRALEYFLSEAVLRVAATFQSTRARGRDDEKILEAQARATPAEA